MDFECAHAGTLQELHCLLYCERPLKTDYMFPLSLSPTMITFAAKKGRKASQIDSANNRRRQMQSKQTLQLEIIYTLPSPKSLLALFA